jgi:hypothetical protein
MFGFPVSPGTHSTVSERLALGAPRVHLVAMEPGEPARAVQVAAAADGTLTYLVGLPPEALPPVRLRDLAAAWDAARSAAITAHWGIVRLFRFRRADGSVTDLALADPDACCWAGAVDSTVGMQTAYGLSLCVRLLALVDLLGRARWADSMFTVKRDGAEIHPALLHGAATAPLTGEARFDEAELRDRVLRRAILQPRLGAPPRPAPVAEGASA